MLTSLFIFFHYSNLLFIENIPITENIYFMHFQQKNLISEKIDALFEID